MTVIILSDTPLAVRGMLKRWFVEVRANVFVGSVNSRVRRQVVDYVRRNSDGLGMLIIGTEKNSQGFSIEKFGNPRREPIVLTGHHLVAEKWEDVDDDVESEFLPF